MALEDKDAKVLQFIISTQAAKGTTPSYREIQQAIGVDSTATVSRKLARLADLGYIRIEGGKSRSIEVLKDTDGNSYNRALSSAGLDTFADTPNPLPELVSVPIVGRVTAGAPILAVENIEDYFPLPVHYAHNSDVFMLHVRGESMINAGIFDGDLILVRKQNDARNGDIVVALLDENVTVKTFYKEKDHIRLQPENDAMAPILVLDCKILGKVIGLYREL